MSYFQLKQEATRLKEELSLLDYFFRLDKKLFFVFFANKVKITVKCLLAVCFLTTFVFIITSSEQI